MSVSVFRLHDVEILNSFENKGKVRDRKRKNAHDFDENVRDTPEVSNEMYESVDSPSLQVLKAI